MPTVVNIRSLTPAALSSVARVDRSTVYGNPFRITTAKQRALVIARFRKYWLADEQEWLRARAVQELRGKDLACWCAPLPCHADILLKWLYSELD